MAAHVHLVLELQLHGTYYVIPLVIMTRCFIIAREQRETLNSERVGNCSWVLSENLNIFLLGEVNKANIMHKTFINCVAESIWLSRHLNANYFLPPLPVLCFCIENETLLQTSASLDQFNHRQRSPNFSKHRAAVRWATISIPLFSGSISKPLEVTHVVFN